MNFDDFPKIVAEGQVYAHVNSIPGRKNCTYCSRRRLGFDKDHCSNFVDRHYVACASPRFGGFVIREHFEDYVVEAVKARMGVADET
jgi:hypothetical protein